MDSSVRKRRARGRRTGFSNVPAELSNHADSFIKLCDRNELRMRQVVDELHDISTKLQRLRSRTEKCSIVGTVTAAVGLTAALAALLAQVTGGLSLALTAAVGYVAAAAAVVTIRTKQFTTEEERVKKIREFLEIVTVLRSQMENITELEDLRTDADGAEADDVISLTNDVLSISTKSDCGADLSNQCEDVFDQFRSVKRRLEEMRGRGGREEPTDGDRTDGQIHRDRRREPTE